MKAEKEKKNPEQFDLCEKAVARKQIKIAPSSKDRKKLLREKSQTSDDKFPIKKFLMLGRTTFLTFQSSRWTSVCSVASLVLMSLFNLA